MYRNREDFSRVLADSEELSECAPKILQHATDCLWFTVANQQPATIEVGASRIGGDPDLPADFTWPTTEQGEPLAFLFQINTTPLEPGMIAVFAGRESSMTDIAHHVEFIAPQTPLVRTPQPQAVSAPSFYYDGDLQDESFFAAPLLLEPHRGVDFPRWSSRAYEEIIGEDGQWEEDYEDFTFDNEMPEGSVIQLRGTHVSYSSSDAGEDACEHYGLAENQASQWVNLVTLFSSPTCCIWDAGLFQIVQYQGNHDIPSTHAAIQSS